MVWLLVPAAYLAGSVQWGLIVVRLTSRVDVRSLGSGKTGMTNVLRTSGKLAAIVVLIADAGKGLALVAAARLLTDDTWVHAVVGSAVIVGHVWPVFAGFRGGRGVATGVGAAVTLDPWAALFGMSIFLPTVAITRYVSLGSVLSIFAVGATFVVRTAVFDAPLPYVWFSVGGGALILWMHRDNIRRLLAGSERRIGERVG